MECAHIRRLLPEYVLGTLRPVDVATVGEHLGWCAGCRKEARELMEGAEAAALAGIEEAEPPPDLERRVVAAVSRAAGRRRRSRAPLAGLLAAALVASVGWGAAMAGRAERLENEAQIARRDATQAARDFALFVQDISGEGVREAALLSTGGRAAGGRAIVYETDVAGASDWALVIVGGLPEKEGPYRAKLLGPRGGVRIGRLWPSSEGRLAAYALYDVLEPGHHDVVVLDSDGAVVLRGRLGPR